MRAFGATAVTIVFLIAGACSGEEMARSCSDAAIDWSLPTESLTDWVSYADQLSTVEILGDEKLWRVPEPGAPPDKFVGRRVEVRISQTGWRRPAAPSAPNRFWMVTDFGWSTDGGLKPISWGEGLRLEVGQRYLVALVRYDDGQWGAYPRATLPIRADGRLGRTCSERPTLKALAGLTVEDAGRLLASTPPDPRAAAHAARPPEQRYRAVVG